jgi:AraC family transcriptional regulator of adaptative response / DNA-3-methyladenine glycosylase II
MTNPASQTCKDDHVRKQRASVRTSAYDEFVVLDPETCYRAMLAHDARFDGCFFVGVSSTRIYCRPVCRVKTPKRENCTFFPSAALAEAAGYRPCLRCRPELAPGNASVDAGQRIAHQAASLIENGSLTDLGMDGIAKRAGVTTRHLRRVFQAEFGVTPIGFAQTQRLLLAKRLLTDTALPTAVIAFTSGFRSLRRFDATFRERYRLTPAEIRKCVAASDSIKLQLSYRPPYDWPTLSSFLAARAIAGVEAVDLSAYRRTVQIVQGGRAHLGWIEVCPDPAHSVMRVTASASLAQVVPAVLARVRHLLDLSCSPCSIAEALGPLAANRPGLRVPGAFDGFEIAVRAILGQQVSVAAARTLACRIAHAFGTPVETPHDGLCRAFPLATRIANLELEDLAQLGVLPSRARTILALAEADLPLEPGVNVEETMAKLRTIPGIGKWTAQYIAMRALAWPDAFPHTDLGVMKALNEKNPKRILAAGEAWRPWRAYAVMHLWTSGSTYGSVR